MDQIAVVCPLENLLIPVARFPPGKAFWVAYYLEPLKGLAGNSGIKGNLKPKGLEFWGFGGFGIPPGRRENKFKRAPLVRDYLRKGKENRFPALPAVWGFLVPLGFGREKKFFH